MPYSHAQPHHTDDKDENVSTLTVDSIEQCIMGVMDMIKMACTVEHYVCDKKEIDAGVVIFLIDLKKNKDDDIDLETIIPGFAATTFPQRITIKLSQHDKKDRRKRRPHIKKVLGFFQSPLPASSGDLFPQGDIRLHTLGSIVDFLYLHLCIPLTILRSLHYSLDCFKEFIKADKFICIKPVEITTSEGQKKLIFKIINSQNKAETHLEISPDFKMNFSHLISPMAITEASFSSSRDNTTPNSTPYSFLVPPVLKNNTHTPVCATTGKHFTDIMMNPSPLRHEHHNTYEHYMEHAFGSIEKTKRQQTPMTHPLILKGLELIMGDLDS